MAPLNSLKLKRSIIKFLSIEYSLAQFDFKLSLRFTKGKDWDGNNLINLKDETHFYFSFFF